MKLLSFLVFTIVTATAVAQDFDNAGSYMDYINKQQQNVSKKFLSYASASAHGKKARKVENLRTKLLNEVQEAKMNINAMPSYKGDKSYRDSAVSFMKLYYNILNDDYAKVINMEDIAEQSYDEMEALIMVREQIDKKLDEGNDRMRNAQKDFASKTNINLVEGSSALGDMMEKVGELNQYYNVIYLLFFKPYVQESNMMQAINKGNITAIEQAKSSMLQYANEGFDKLKSIKPFDGDNSLAASCRSALSFYAAEAGKMNGITDYFLVKERFETMKKDFDKKSDHSKEDVDKYNKGVNDFNKASQQYNQTSKQLGDLRREMLNNWNRSVDEFIDTHTPKYK